VSALDETLAAVRNWVESDVVPLRLHAGGMTQLCDAVDHLRAMVGLVDLLLNRDDLPVDVRNVLRSNHRIVAARAALNPAGPS